MTPTLLHEYEGEWKIDTSAPFKEFISPPFSLLPDNSVICRFETMYQEVRHPHMSMGDLTLFKLKLTKVSSINISSSLIVSINANTYYSDGSLFDVTASKLTLNVQKMNVVIFEDIIREMYLMDGSFSEHYDRMTTNYVELKCCMSIYDTIPMESLKYTNQMRNNTVISAINNYMSLYDSGVLCDCAFNVGDKSFSFHKAVLAAHSPVFQKMMTQDFLESKTNCVTITDATPETFDLFLKCLYAGDIVDKSWANVEEIYYLAEKYDVAFLKDACCDAAISLLSVDLVCEMLIVAEKYENLRLKEEVKRVAAIYIQELIVREDWKDLAATNPAIGYEILLAAFQKK